MGEEDMIIDEREGQCRSEVKLKREARWK